MPTLLIGYYAELEPPHARVSFRSPGFLLFGRDDGILSIVNRGWQNVDKINKNETKGQTREKAAKLLTLWNSNFENIPYLPSLTTDTAFANCKQWP
jgi:hypothetical protein